AIGCSRAVGRGCRILRAIVGDELRPTRLLVDTGRPGQLCDEREGALQLAGLRVNDIKEAVAVGLGAKVAAVLLVRDEFVDTVKIPSVVGCFLEVPDDLAGCHIEGESRARVEVVTLAQMTVPGRGIARTEVHEARCRVVGSPEPRRRS